MTFHRPTLAADMADQLLRPKGLMKKVRSGLFLGGLRRIGKTTFLRGDLIPTLEAQGAIVVYVDLWSNTAAKPSDLLLGAVRKTLADLQRADSKAVGVLKRLKGLDLGAAGFKFGFSLAELGKTEGNTLAGAFSELVQVARTDVVVIIDEVQHAMGSDDGNDMLLALKAARDEINLRPITEGVRQSAAAVDLARLDELGPLALAIFGYVCRQGGQSVKKVFSAATLDEYSAEVGRPVGAEEVQKMANQLVDSNILARDGHGIYGVSDPFLAEAYTSRANVLRTLDGPRGAG